MSADFETIAAFTDFTQARRAQSRLRIAGIEAELAESADGAGIDLRVPGNDAPEARACLEDLDYEENHFTAHPRTVIGQVHLAPPSDEEDPPPTSREADAQRAFVVTALSMLCVPFQLYALYLLLRVFVSNDELRPAYLWKAWLAAALNLPLLAIFFLLALLLAEVLSEVITMLVGN